MNQLAAIQRAELFRDVDELKAWKKSCDRREAELIAWQAMVMERLQAIENSISTTLQGCNVLVECDTKLGDRIDIVNKRLRKLEETNKKLQTQMSMIEDAIVNDPRLQDE